jgi:hypothetical protein
LKSNNYTFSFVCFAIEKSFWVDNQARENVAVDDGAVPLYNREFTLGSTPLGDSSNNERYGLL